MLKNTQRVATCSLKQFSSEKSMTDFSIIDLFYFIVKKKSFLKARKKKEEKGIWQNVDSGLSLVFSLHPAAMPDSL